VEAGGGPAALSDMFVTGAASAELAELLDDRMVALLAERARAQAAEGGLKLLGDGGLLQAITKRVIEAALEEELAEHLAMSGRGCGPGRNERNGKRRKKVLTEVGTVEVAVPRDRAGTFAPEVVAKRRRRTSGIDELVVSLTARGLTTGEIAAHLKEVYDIETSKETISNITDRVLEGMHAWRTRPLDPCYPVVMVDAIHVKIRDGGRVENRPVYIALAVTCDGLREMLGLWVGDGAEGASFWGRMCQDLKDRRVADICILLCDSLKGLPEQVNAVWPRTVIQTSIIHLIRSSLRHASKADWPTLAEALRPIYTAADEEAAVAALAEFDAVWGEKYAVITKRWEQAWSEFVPFLAFDREIRSVICSTNAIESVNARYRRVVTASGHFPSEQAALKRIYLATLALDPSGKGSVRWADRWKEALDAFDLKFDGRVSAGRR
jgi:transposase-like protein